MTTVCREHHHVQVRPGRACPACRGWAPAPAPAPTRSTSSLWLIEDTFRARRAAGTWPTDWPVPVNPGDHRPHREDRRP